MLQISRPVFSYLWGIFITLPQIASFATASFYGHIQLYAPEMGGELKSPVYWLQDLYSLTFSAKSSLLALNYSDLAMTNHLPEDFWMKNRLMESGGACLDAGSTMVKKSLWIILLQ